MAYSSDGGLVVALVPMHAVYSPLWLGHLLDWLLPFLRVSTDPAPIVDDVQVAAYATIMALLYGVGPIPPRVEPAPAPFQVSFFFADWRQTRRRRSACACGPR